MNKMLFDYGSVQYNISINVDKSNVLLKLIDSSRTTGYIDLQKFIGLLIETKHLNEKLYNDMSKIYPEYFI